MAIIAAVLPVSLLAYPDGKEKLTKSLGGMRHHVLNRAISERQRSSSEFRDCIFNDHRDNREMIANGPWPALAVLGVLLVAGQSGMSELQKAQADYAARQERLRCQAHPDQGCLTRPESENERATREYRERQERIRGCKYDAEGVSCR